MQLLKTLINLRNNLSWSSIYNECVYPWLNGSVDNHGRKNYAALLKKLPSKLDIKDEDCDKIDGGSSYLEYRSLESDGCHYLCFVHGTKGNGFFWRTKVALKKDANSLLCFVSLECESKGASSFPRLSKPRIIDYLIKFQAGDGDVDYASRAHILTNADVVDAKNILLGKKKNRLPIIYLSCAGETHAIMPNVLAEQLFGFAHVFAEKDKHLTERIKHDIKTRIPQKGSIGVCYPGKPISIINRNGAKAKDFVQSIYLSILKSSLSAKFDFSWNDFIEVRNQYEKDLAERVKQSALAEQQKEKEAAEREARKSREKIEKNDPAIALKDESLKQRVEKIKNTVSSFKKAYKDLYADLKSADDRCKELSDSNLEHKQLIAELKQEISNLKADKDALANKNEALEGEKATYETWIKEEEEKNRSLVENVSNLEATNESLRKALQTQKNLGGSRIPLFMPAEEEMYENECVCQLINLFKRAVDILPRAKNTNTQRSIDVIDSILKANIEAVKIFERKNNEKEILESYACKAELHKPKGIKAMKPFNMECGSKENNHGEPRFVKDKSERYSATEACTPSDKKRGSINGGKDTVKALLW